MTNLERKSKVELPLRHDAEIAQLVRDFESLRLPCENWTHRAHLAVALHYVRRLAFDAALAEVRERINNYNAACGNHQGYNETVTILFLRKIAAECRPPNAQFALYQQLARLEVLCNVDWMYGYYSQNLIWSTQARQQWLEPDLRELDF